VETVKISDGLYQEQLEECKHILAACRSGDYRKFERLNLLRLGPGLPLDNPHRASVEAQKQFLEELGITRTELNSLRVQAEASGQVEDVQIDETRDAIENVLHGDVPSLSEEKRQRPPKELYEMHVRRGQEIAQELRAGDLKNVRELNFLRRAPDQPADGVSSSHEIQDRFLRDIGLSFPELRQYRITANEQAIPDNEEEYIARWRQLEEV